MPLNSPEANLLFRPLFDAFKRGHDCLVGHANAHAADFDEILPRELRLFKVRLRLAIGLIIRFDKDFALVKSGLTEKAYVEIMRCNEAWFAYEAMNKMCESWGWRKTPIKTPVDLFDEDTLSNFGVAGLLDLFNQQLRRDVYAKPGIADDIRHYVAYLKEAVDGPPLKAILGPVADKIAARQDWQPKEILAVMYATRNIFVHKGETAKAGIKYYKNKILLLRMLFDFAILFQLRVINYALEDKIRQYRLIQ